MQSPFVSVIIPNFNHAPFLQQRIDTVLFQTYENFEIILLDDCSTDDSLKIIEQYKEDKRFSHILYNEHNSGSAFIQWTRGIRLSKGDYIWIAESDDWCEPTFLETVINGIIGNENCVLGYCQSYYIEERNNILWQSKHTGLAEFISGEKFISNYMLTGTAIYNASMAVWRKDVFELISENYLQYKTCGDWLFWIEICRHGNVFISGKLLNYFRNHTKNISGDAILSGNSIVEELRMFASIYNQGWISEEDFFKALKSQYVQFKAVEKKIDPGKKSQIKSLFFNETIFAHRLKAYYRRIYIRYLITKISNKIFARS